MKPLGTVGRPLNGLDRCARWAGRLGESGLAVSLFAVPVLLGGRHGFAASVYIASAGTAAVGLLTQAMLRRRSVHPPLALCGVWCVAILLTLTQIVPLPVPLLEAIGPNWSDILPAWNNEGVHAPWNRLSLTPQATAQSLAILVAHGLLLIAWGVRLRKSEDTTLAVRWLAIAAVGMALIGIWQYAFGGASLFGLYRLPHRAFDESLQGTFTNRNHFAHFLVLGFSPACWLAWRSESQRERMAGFAGATLIATCVVATQSRGGVIALVVAATVFMALAWRFQAISKRTLGIVLAASLLVLGGVTLFDYEQSTRRMNSLLTGQIDQIDAQHARRSIWLANLSAFQASPWVGFGAGSHADVYPLFIDRAFPVEFTHAESSCLQIASETGAAGCVLLVIALGTIGVITWRCGARTEDQTRGVLFAAVTAGLVASVLHATVDFVWHIPALIAPITLLLAVLIQLDGFARETQAEDTGRSRNPFHRSPSCWAASVTALAAFAFILSLPAARTAFDWDRYLSRSRSLRAMSERTEFAATETDPELEATIATTIDQMIHRLGNVIRKNPKDALAHLRMAGRLLQSDAVHLNEHSNPMSLDLLRDAAEHGEFQSKQQRAAWLKRALGPRFEPLAEARRHAKAALAGRPLQPSGYLYLAQLAFLNPEAPRLDRLIDQAVLLGPRNGSVLFEAGRLRWLDGDESSAAELWRRAVQLPGPHLSVLMRHVTALMPAEDFLSQLDPNLTAMEVAIAQYQTAGRKEDLVALCQAVTEKAIRAEADQQEDPVRLAYRWRQVSQTLRGIDKPEEAVGPAQRATRLAPHLYGMRSELATTLYEAGRLNEADPHIRWCLARRPDLRYLQRWLVEIERQRMLAMRASRTPGRDHSAPLFTPHAAPPTRNRTSVSPDSFLQ